jgi:hypothetical protein
MAYDAPLLLGKHLSIFVAIVKGDGFVKGRSGGCASSSGGTGEKGEFGTVGNSQRQAHRRSFSRIPQCPSKNRDFESANVLVKQQGDAT